MNPGGCEGWDASGLPWSPTGQRGSQRRLRTDTVTERNGESSTKVGFEDLFESCMAYYDPPSACYTSDSSAYDDLSSPAATPQDDLDVSDVDLEQIMAFLWEQSEVPAAAVVAPDTGQNDDSNSLAFAQEHASAPLVGQSQPSLPAMARNQTPAPISPSLQDAAADDAINFLVKFLGSHDKTGMGVGQGAGVNGSTQADMTAQLQGPLAQQLAAPPLMDPTLSSSRPGYQRLLRDVLARLRPLAAREDETNAPCPLQPSELQDLTVLLQRLMEMREQQETSQANDPLSLNSSMKAAPSINAARPHFMDLRFDDDDNDPDFTSSEGDMEHIDGDFWNTSNTGGAVMSTGPGMPAQSSYNGEEGSPRLSGVLWTPAVHNASRTEEQVARALQGLSGQPNILSSDWSLYEAVSPAAPLLRSPSRRKHSSGASRQYPVGDPDSPLSGMKSGGSKPNRLRHGSARDVVDIPKPRRARQEETHIGDGDDEQPSSSAADNDDPKQNGDEPKLTALQKRRLRKAEWTRQDRAKKAEAQMRVRDQWAAEEEVVAEREDLRKARLRAAEERKNMVADLKSGDPGRDARQEALEHIKQKTAEERVKTKRRLGKRAPPTSSDIDESLWCPSPPTSIVAVPSSSPVPNRAFPTLQRASNTSADTKPSHEVVFLRAKIQLLERKVADLQIQNDELRIKQIVWESRATGLLHDDAKVEASASDHDDAR